MVSPTIQAFIDREADESPYDFSDLRAVIFNGTLKRSPEVSNTEGLADISIALMRRLGVTVDVIRTADHVIPPGVQLALRASGYERDDFPDLYARLVRPADILVLATPVWLGDQSSQTRLIIERLPFRFVRCRAGSDMSPPSSG